MPITITENNSPRTCGAKTKKDLISSRRRGVASRSQGLRRSLGVGRYADSEGWGQREAPALRVSSVRGRKSEVGVSQPPTQTLGL